MASNDFTRLDVLAAADREIVGVERAIARTDCGLRNCDEGSALARLCPATVSDFGLPDILRLSRMI